MQRPVTIYAVLDLDFHNETDDLSIENSIIFALSHKLNRKLNRIMKKKKVVNITVVGAADKTNADLLSVLLKRIMCILNTISKPDKIFKDFILLNKNNHGKVLCADSPPCDIAGCVIFLTSRPYIRELLKDKRSWWGETGGRLTSVSKLKLY